MGSIARLSAVFLAVKAAQVVLVVATPGIFDISLSIFLRSHRFGSPVSEVSDGFLQSSIIHQSVTWLRNRFLARLVTWDAVYFADMFQNGLKYEHQFVFCPLWWRLIRKLTGTGSTLENKLWMAVLVGNTCHWLAMVVLYKYTMLVFRQARLFHAPKMAFASGVFFAALPASVFLLAPYSEAIGALFSLSSLWLREEGVRFRVAQSERREWWNMTAYVISGLLAGLAFWCRANCLLLGVVYFYDLWKMPRAQKWQPLVAGLVLGFAFLSSNAYNYWAICHNGDRGEWCLGRVPSLFAYAQDHYWNLGFFRYWRMNNIPNFLFAAPTVVLSAASIVYFWWHYPVEHIAPVLAVNMVFLVALLTGWHVQIITRIHTFLPLVYWVSSGIWYHGTDKLRWVMLTYFVIWGFLLPILFGAFLPPA